MKKHSDILAELFNLSRGVASAGFTTSKSVGATMKDDEKDGLDAGGRAEKFPGGRPQLASPDERPELQDRDETEYQKDFMKEAVHPEDFKDTLGDNAEKLLKKGIDVNNLTPLGAGSYGVAYDIGGGKVFKITGDPTEAVSSFALVGKNYPNIVTIHDVFKFEKMAKPQFAPPGYRYGLILDKLTPLSETEKNEFRKGMKLIDEAVEQKQAITRISGVDWEDWEDWVRDQAYANGMDEEAEEGLSILKQFNVNDMAADLYSAGIGFLDYHSGNIMKKGSLYVVTDLGVSKPNSKREPPVLEKKRIKEEAEPDVDPAELPDNPEEHGYNEDGFKLEDRYEFQGLPISIEQAQGSSREWTDRDGNSGSTTMAHAYGYVEGCEGADGDAVDVYMGPNEKAEWVYVIHQMSTPEFTEFDEDKCMLGFDSEEAAKKAYLDHYDKPDFYGGMSSMKIEDFKKKLVKRKSPKITNETKDTHASSWEKTHGFKHIDLRNLSPNDELTKKMKEREYADADLALLFTAWKSGFDQSKDAFKQVMLDPVSRRRMISFFNTNNSILQGGKLFRGMNFKESKGWKKGDVIELNTTGKHQVQSWTDSQQKAKRFHGKNGYLLQLVETDADVLYDFNTAPTDTRFALNDSEREVILFHKTKTSARVVKVGAANEQTSIGEVLDTIEVKKMKEADDLFSGGTTDTSNGSKPLTDPGQLAGSDPTNEKDAREILTKNAEKLAKKGIDVSKAKALGKGTQGTAFDIGGGKVLKVTKDAKEAQASNKIKGQKLKYVANILDVFRFKDVNAYGILQEKLSPLSDSEKKDFNQKLVWTGLPVWLKSANTWDDAIEKVFNYVEKKKAKGDVQSPEGKRIIQWTDQFVDSLESEYNVKGSWEELKGKGVSFSDYQADNLMKRGSEFVLIDIGLSDVTGGTEPDVLEKLVREAVAGFFLSESDNERNNIPDTVGVTIGRFQPFHKGHADLVRKLTNQFDKVIILVAGNDDSKEENPFSYETRVELMMKSLRDVVPKLEVHKAEFQGKDSGYIPGIVSDIVDDTKSSINHENAINILVGSDRFASFTKQIEHAKENPDKISIDPFLINIQQLPRTNEEDVAGYSSSKIRKALLDNDKATVEKMLDPHVTSDQSSFDNIYTDLRDELGVSEPSEEQDIQEGDLFGGGSDSSSTTATPDRANLKSVGGEPTIVNALKANADKLKKHGFDVSTLKVLGHGEMGIAYDAGGDKVLKITTDASEAKASFKIKGKNLKSVVHIDEVWKIPETDPQLYALATEKLTPLSNNEKDLAKNAFEFIRSHEPALRSIATDDWDTFVGVLYEELEKDTIQESGLNPDLPGPANKIRKATTRRHTFIVSKLKELRVPEMVDDLRQAGIQFGDYHEDNLMKRGNEFVINDLGSSKVAGGGDPPVLEKMIRTIMDGFGDGMGLHAVGARAASSAWSGGGNMFTDDETDPSKTER